MHKQITSLQNPLIKSIILLSDKSRERKKQRRFVIEGRREIRLAIKGGYEVETLLFSSELTTEEQISELQQSGLTPIETIEVSNEVYQKIAYRSSTEGMVAIAKSKELALDKLVLSDVKSPLLLVAEAPEKPGNIGALLRTADAAKVDAILIANPRTDMYNPNILRSSVGGIFTNNIATGSTPEIISFLKDHNIEIYSAILQEAIPYFECDFTKAAAIVVGTEADGLSETWREASSQNVIIPMQGEIDSMNVSVAAGILIFEAKRQRRF